MSLSCTLLNADAGAIGRIFLWGFKFGTVEPRGRIVPTCTANCRAGEVQEGVAPGAAPSWGIKKIYYLQNIKQKEKKKP